jgi:hypothetical protein
MKECSSRCIASNSLMSISAPVLCYSIIYHINQTKTNTKQLLTFMSSNLLISLTANQLRDSVNIAEKTLPKPPSPIRLLKRKQDLSITPRAPRLSKLWDLTRSSDDPHPIPGLCIDKELWRRQKAVVRITTSDVLNTRLGTD